MVNLKTKGRPRPYTVVLSALLGIYIALLAMISWGDAAGPERWWWSSLNMYLPQWAWGLPGLALLAASRRLTRRRAWLPALCLLWVAGPLMGFAWHGLIPAPPPPGSTHLRLLTYNVKWGKRGLGDIVDEIDADSPDLLLMQDAGDLLGGPLKRYFHDWHAYSTDQYIVASRYPLSDFELRSLSPGGSGKSEFNYLRFRMKVGRTSVTVYDVHLITPRNGLAAMKSEGDDGIPSMEINTADRLFQAGLVAEDLRNERGPVLLAGDLNAPVYSLVCRTLFQTGLRDAFSDRGWGYGYTYGQYLRFKSAYVRIDHILYSPEWRAERCWAGNSTGSDHRPVIADLSLKSE